MAYCRLAPFVVVAACIVLGASGCGGAGASPTAHCHVAADCASNRCLPDGTCDLVASDANLPADSAAHGDDMFAPGDTDAPSGDAAVTVCVNQDDIITAQETSFGPFAEAMFRVTRGNSDVASTPECRGGTCVGDCTAGDCFWNFTYATGTTTEEFTETLLLSGFWFASEPAFAHATYVTKLTDYVDPIGACPIQVHYGVFRFVTTGVDAGLYLLGFASDVSQADAPLCYSLLIYSDPDTEAPKPLPLVRYPLSLGATWSTEVAAIGTLTGYSHYVIPHSYVTKVDKVGSVLTPFSATLEFTHVLRVNTSIHRHHVPFVPAVSWPVAEGWSRQQMFVVACTGSIAVLSSYEDAESEVAPEFLGAKELKRLSVF